MNTNKLLEMMINAGIEDNEAKKELSMLLEHFCNYTEKDKLLGKEIDNSQYATLKKKVIERINTRKPIQHIIGEAYFMNNYFKVNSSVLIPRPETELLVQKCIDLINRNTFNTVLDIGTGSGCIACTIALNTNAIVLGIDISNDALRVALDNVTKLNINNKAIFRKSDIFSNIHTDEKFDIIVSNPPYIPIGTKLDIEVMQEPHIALFAEDNGLSFYKRIIEEAPKFLNKNGFLLFELGMDEKNDVENMLKQDFNTIDIIKDLANIDRVVVAQLK